MGWFDEVEVKKERKIIKFCCYSEDSCWEIIRLLIDLGKSDEDLRLKFNDGKYEIWAY